MITTWANLIPLSANRALAYGISFNNRPYEVDMRWNDEDYTLDEDSYLELVTTGQKLYIHSVINVDFIFKKAKLVCTEKK